MRNLQSSHPDGGIANRYLAESGMDVILAYEDAATAAGRLDATGKLSPAGIRELLVLRCIATPDSLTSDRMIALAHEVGERDDPMRIYAAAVRGGAARARGGALASVASLRELLRLPASDRDTAPLDALLADTHERTPPMLKAGLAALAIREAAGETGDDTATARLAALTATLVLCVGGATTDAWLTLPRPRAEADLSLRGTFVSLAREARAAERGLLLARELCEADVHRVRGSLGRAAYSALDVLGLMREKLVITIPETARFLGLTPPTAGAAVARLAELGIAREVTGRERSRAYAYEGVFRALQP